MICIDAASMAGDEGGGVHERLDTVVGMLHTLGEGQGSVQGLLQEALQSLHSLTAHEQLANLKCFVQVNTHVNTRLDPYPIPI